MAPIILHAEAEEEVPEQTELAAGRFRDEFQLQVDRDVEVLKHATAMAGWPPHNPKKLYHRYVTDADGKAALKQVIRRACTLHKVDAEFYKDAKTAAGHIAIKFHVQRKTDKDGNSVADDTLDEHGKPKHKLAFVPRPGSDARPADMPERTPGESGHSARPPAKAGKPT